MFESASPGFFRIFQMFDFFPYRQQVRWCICLECRIITQDFVCCPQWRWKPSFWCCRRRVFFSFGARRNDVSTLKCCFIILKNLIVFAFFHWQDCQRWKPSFWWCRRRVFFSFGAWCNDVSALDFCFLLNKTHYFAFAHWQWPCIFFSVREWDQKERHCRWYYESLWSIANQLWENWLTD